jgi:uncharacterized RDD family membrane protein YckC
MTPVRLAGFATRGLGFVLDLLILDVAALSVGGALTWLANVVGVDVGAGLAAGLALGGWLLLFSIYLVVFWSLAGQTPGMRFMGIRVTDRTGATPGLVRSLRRLVGMYLAALPLGAGFLMVLVDDRRRGLQDRIARTLVIHDARTPRRSTDHLVRMMPDEPVNGSMATPAPSTTKDLKHAASP